MSYSTTRPTKTTNRGSGTMRGQGRGAGRGRQTRHDMAVSRSGPSDKDVYENCTYNERRRGSSAFPHSNNNSGRGQKLFKSYQNGNSMPHRAHCSPGDSTSPDLSFPRIPKHAQHPYFRGELLNRFNKMLPSTFLEEEKDPNSIKPDANQVLNLDIDCIRDNRIKNPDMNINSGKKHFKHTKKNVPHTNFRHEDPQSSSSSLLNRVKKSENFRTEDNSNKSHISVSDNHKNDSKLEQRLNIYDKKAPTSSNKCNNRPVTIKTITQDERKKILKNYGFSLNSSNQTNPGNSKSNTTEDKNEQGLPQSLPCGQIASRTSPRVRYNLENETTQSIVSGFINEQIEKDYSNLKPGNQLMENSSQIDGTSAKVEQLSPKSTKPNCHNVNGSNCSPENSSKADLINGIKIKAENSTRPIGYLLGISNEFFKRLDALGCSNDSGTLKSPPNSMSVGKIRNGHSNNQINNYNPFLVQNSPELIEKDVTGSNHFSVNRPVRDNNERVASREEALERCQENYEIQRAINEAKKKEKEAKKREEYLAKYKHVDQGYRLNDGLLDEAAGYAPGFNPFEAIDAARERQQHEFKQRTLDYQERTREKEEKEKRREQKKMNEKLEKNKHVNVGYRLGSSGNQGPLGIRRPSSPSARKNKNGPQASGKSDEKLSGNSISPDLLLDGETEEEFHQRLEEHYMVEKLMKNQLDLIKRNTEVFEQEQYTEEFDYEETQSSANSVALNLCTKNISQTAVNPPVTSERQAAITPRLGPTRQICQRVRREMIGFTGSPIMEPSCSRAMKVENTTEQFTEPNRNFMSKEPIPSKHTVQGQLNHTSDSSKMKLGHTSAGCPMSVGNLIEQTPEKKQNFNKNVVIKDLKPSPAADNLGSKRQSQSPPLEQLDYKLCRSSVVEVPAPHQVPSAPDSSPASCTLKNRNGAVLVLRPTVEALNQSLASKLEVQDQMDKLGYSTVYKPQTEQVSLYNHNRFEQYNKSDLNTVKPRATGAIPKRSSGSAVKATISDVAANNETPKQEEPPIDYKAEMLAARLRFQQQYEEALKRKQQQKDEPQD